METITLDGKQPVRSLAGSLRPSRRRLIAAAAVFAVKDSPLWLMPVITGAAVDAVVQGGPMSTLGWLAIGAAVLVVQNAFTHVWFTRLYMGAVRSLGAGFRNALAARLQLLSIGFHSRSNASIIQTQGRARRRERRDDVRSSRAGRSCRRCSCSPARSP